MLTAPILADNLELEIRDNDLKTIAWNVAATKLTARQEWLGTSGWTLTLPTYGANGKVSPDALAINTPGAGIIVRDRDSRLPIFSGFPNMTDAGTRSAVAHIVDSQNGLTDDRLEVSGIADFGILGERTFRLYDVLAFVDDPASGRYILQTFGTASSGLNTILLNNITTHGAGSDRGDPRVKADLDPPLFGTPTSLEVGVGEQLLSVVARLCKLADITVDLIQRGEQIEYIIRQPADLSEKIVFSADQGTLDGFAVEPEPTQATFVYGVRGLGDTREVYEAFGPTTPLRRIEKTVAVSGTEAVGPSTIQAYKELAGRPTMRADPNAADLRYGIDYQVGDYVGIDVIDLATGRPKRYKERITAVDLEWTADGATIELEVGGPQPYGVNALVRAVVTIKEQLEAAERSDNPITRV